MKSYKLIKEYPASPKLGFIVFERHCGMYHNIDTGNMYGSQMIENQPEYWEEVIEKDYEILISRVVPQEILSVKRLSDGEVFTIGDRITGYHKDVRIIQTIKICPYTKIIRLEQSGGFTDLGNATKAKQRLFITHDGKDIFAGDIVWWVHKENFYFNNFKVDPETYTFNSFTHAYFLTEEAAEDYIIKNKPVLSIEDFWEFVSWGGSGIAKSKRLKRLVKKRLGIK